MGDQTKAPKKARALHALTGAGLLRRCVFCLKTTREVVAMIGSEPGARICNECVGLCMGILRREAPPAWAAAKAIGNESG